MSVKVWVGTDSGNVGDYSTAANWSPSGVPVAADDVIFANSSQDVLSGFDQSAVALASITIDQSYLGVFGAAASDFLEVAASVCEIGQSRGSTGSLTGSKQLNVDFGTSTACQVRVYNSATSAKFNNRQPIRIRAVNASTDISVFGGSVAISDDSSNTSTIGDISITGGTVAAGAGITLTNVIMNGGSMTLQSSIAGTATIKGGTLNHYDSTTSSTIATLTTSDSGSVNHYATGTVTTINSNGGSIDLTKSQVAKTITNLVMDEAGLVVLDTGLVTITNGITLASSKEITITAS